ncbi:NADH-ubiquinone oxidoreductase kd subunit [Coniochaeta sp. 2T2.1]|nr:NADH-ubiquinone oxidoreductase kd subunit [Coniochaeta sp. 2T2.1]
MVSRVLFWAGFGVATRAWQLGIEMRPLFMRQSLWAYPVFAGVGASFGYWLEGVDERQTAILEERKKSILEKRARRSEKEIGNATGAPGLQNVQM